MRTVAFAEPEDVLDDIPVIVGFPVMRIALDVESDSTIYRYVRTLPGFPQPVRIGKLKTGFYKHELIAYLRGLQRAKDAPVHHEGKLHLKSPSGKKHVAGKRRRAA